MINAALMMNFIAHLDLSVTRTYLNSAWSPAVYIIHYYPGLGTVS